MKNINKLLPGQSTWIFFLLSPSDSLEQTDRSTWFVGLVQISQFQWNCKCFSLSSCLLILNTANLKAFYGNLITSESPHLCNLWPTVNRHYVKLSSFSFPLYKLHLRYICSLAPQLKWTEASLLQLSTVVKLCCLFRTYEDNYSYFLCIYIGV